MTKFPLIYSLRQIGRFPPSCMFFALSWSSCTGFGGGFMEREENVQYKESRTAAEDDEYDEVGVMFSTSSQS